MIELVTVRYENGKKDFFSVNFLELHKDDMVIIETDRGMQVGTVITDVKSFSKKDVADKIFKVVRILTPSDFKQFRKNETDAKEALEKAIFFAKELQLDMRFIDCFYTFDKNQLVFNFISDSRVDFRELARRLAQLYKTRIELRQVGVRDKAKNVGGIGPCGRFLCCTTFLTDFDSVSINMAKNQYIALNPTKINGVCGRLLCCLKYEDSQYKEMKKGVPKIGQTVEYGKIKGKVSSVNLLTNKIILEQPNKTFVEVDLEKENGSSK